jgi:hypothetical protein
MKTAFIVISSILAIVNILPYLRDVYRGKNKPRVVSWFTWSLLTGIASAASFSDGQYASGILLLLSSLETLSVVILGWRFGVREFDLFDAACQAAAVVGLVLWLIFNSPTIAIIATISIDIAASLPTLRHAWRRPFEETAVTFFLGGLAALFTFMAAKNFKITAVAFPIYLVLMNFLISSVIYSRQHNLKSG